MSLIKKRGFSILELVVSFALLSITLVFSLQLYAFNEDSIIVGKAKVKLMERATYEMKTLSNFAETNFDELVSSSTLTEGITVTIVVKESDPLIKHVTINASFATSSGRFLPTVLLERTFYNLDRRREQGSCTIVESDDWKNPSIIDSVQLSGSSTATSLKVQNGIAYVGANSSKLSDPDLYIYDVSDPTQLQLLGSLNTGPGIIDLTLSYPYLFLANTSINAQLQIIDISDPKTPKIKSSLKLQGFNDGGYVGNAVSLYKNIVALGTKKSDGPELHFIDVTDPLLPLEKGAYEFGAGINSLWQEKNYVYVATPLDEELTILSILDIEKPKYVGGFNAAGLSGNGKSIYKLGNMYVGRTIGKGEFLKLDTTNHDEPKLLSSTTLSTSIDALYIREGFAFLGTIDPKAQFQIWRTDTTPSFLSSLELNGRATDIGCDNKTVFVTTSGTEALYSITNK